MEVYLARSPGGLGAQRCTGFLRLHLLTNRHLSLWRQRQLFCMFCMHVARQRVHSRSCSRRRYEGQEQRANRRRHWCRLPRSTMMINVINFTVLGVPLPVYHSVFHCTTVRFVNC
jgi:hypothetical protein